MKNATAKETEKTFVYTNIQTHRESQHKRQRSFNHYSEMRKIERACRIISSGIDANRLYFTHVMRFDGSRISLSQIERRTTHRLDYYKMRVYYFVIVELVRAEIQWNDNAISIW